MRIRNNLGFSLGELITIMGIISVLAVIAIPNFIGSRSGANLRGAVENLKGDLQIAKLKSVQHNDDVTVSFSADGRGYTVSGAGLTFRDRSLPPGVSIDIGTTDFGGNDFVTFNNRGLPENAGTVVVVSSSGDQRNIGLNRLGRININ